MNNTTCTDLRPIVLIVDDDQDTAALYTDFLSEEYRVRTAYSGADALDLVDEDVDVVLLDRDMPGVSGDEVLRTIRERELGCRVVMITGIKPDILVLDLPFDDYVVKPASGDRIRAVVSAMLVRNRYDETIQELVALTSKMATIESKLSIAELGESPEYAAVEARFATLRAQAELGKPTDDLYTEFTAEKIQALFS
ncbi:response regulator [Halalkalirubrum salinum]|uniref:response regulator n=1 Tax=Halalkalirubrum salinum TaxID=2563889 RepID=UPI0010FB1C38|nr:response regulator [Halalkalirubrum salinum]